MQHMNGGIRRIVIQPVVCQVIWVGGKWIDAGGQEAVSRRERFLYFSFLLKINFLCDFDILGSTKYGTRPHTSSHMSQLQKYFKNLYLLCEEYEFGLDGKKPAQDFTTY